MPPRSKQTQRQAEWSQCVRCECHISTRDVDVHAEVCKDDQHFSCDLSDTKTCLQQHCFIRCGLVLAKLDGKYCDYDTVLMLIL